MNTKHTLVPKGFRQHPARNTTHGAFGGSTTRAPSAQKTSRIDRLVVSGEPFLLQPKPPVTNMPAFIRRLTDEQVRKIRAEYAALPEVKPVHTYPRKNAKGEISGSFKHINKFPGRKKGVMALARRYGVGGTLIDRIAKRETYADIK